MWNFCVKNIFIYVFIVGYLSRRAPKYNLGNTTEIRWNIGVSVFFIPADTLKMSAFSDKRIDFLSFYDIIILLRGIIF